MSVGIAPEPVAERVVQAIRDNDLYIFTHVKYALSVEARFRRIRDAFTKSRTSRL